MVMYEKHNQNYIGDKNLCHLRYNTNSNKIENSIHVF